MIEEEKEEEREAAAALEVAPSLDRKFPVASALRYRSVLHGDGSRRPSDGHSSRETGDVKLWPLSEGHRGPDGTRVRRDIRVAVIPDDKVWDANWIRIFE